MLCQEKGIQVQVALPAAAFTNFSQLLRAAALLCALLAVVYFKQVGHKGNGAERSMGLAGAEATAAASKFLCTENFSCRRLQWQGQRGRGQHLSSVVVVFVAVRICSCLPPFFGIVFCVCRFGCRDATYLYTFKVISCCRS